MEVILRDHEIECLQEQLDQAKPRKHRKIIQDLNEHFASLAQVLAQANRKPRQRLRKTAQKVVVDKEEDSSESENERVPARRSARDRRLTKRFLERDSSVDKESD